MQLFPTERSTSPYKYTNIEASSCSYLRISQTTTTAPVATIDLPTALSPRVLNALKADARTVDLRGQAAHFFSLGARMLDLFEEDEMVDVLSSVSSFRITQRTSLP